MVSVGTFRFDFLFMTLAVYHILPPSPNIYLSLTFSLTLIIPLIKKLEIIKGGEKVKRLKSMTDKYSEIEGK
jgi:hypothetical protein